MMELSKRKTKIIKWIGIFALLFASFLAWRAINPLILEFRDTEPIYDPAIVFCTLPEAVEVDHSMAPNMGCGFFLQVEVMDSKDGWEYYCNSGGFNYVTNGTFASICEKGRLYWIGE